MQLKESDSLHYNHSTLWRLFRDLTYFLIVIFIVIVGFLIMFRFKINAQTVASLETQFKNLRDSSIDNFLLSIAGFLIDLMYLITAVMINVLAGNGIFPINAAEYRTYSSQVTERDCST